MKVVRVLKWIAFVVFILAFALSAVANTIVFYDVARVTKADATSTAPFLQHILLNESDDLLMDDIQRELADLPFGLDNLRAPMEAYSLSYAEPFQPEAPVEPEDAGIETEPEFEPTFEGEAIGGETSDEIDEEFIDEIDEEFDEELDWPVDDEAEGEASSGSVAFDARYDVKDHCNLVVGVMKFGCASFPADSFLNKLGFENVSFNISFFVSMCALFLAFLFRVISKHFKTVYGTVLMILGYLFFMAFVVASVYANNVVNDLLSISETTDCARYTYLITVALTALGALIGLPIYSCGIRQITNKRLRRRLSRRGH